MTYKTEFPGFVLGVEIPEHFEDTSWHNDACPSWEVIWGVQRAIRIYIDFARPEDREYPACRRFQGYSAARHGKAGGARSLETDDWGEVLAWVEAKLELERRTIQTRSEK